MRITYLLNILITDFLKVLFERVGLIGLLLLLCTLCFHQHRTNDTRFCLDKVIEKIIKYFILYGTFVRQVNSTEAVLTRLFFYILLITYFITRIIQVSCYLAYFKYRPQTKMARAALMHRTLSLISVCHCHKNRHWAVKLLSVGFAGYFGWLFSCILISLSSHSLCTATHLLSCCKLLPGLFKMVTAKQGKVMCDAVNISSGSNISGETISGEKYQ